MIIPFYFIDRVLNVAYNITLNSHHKNHINTKLTNEANNLEIEKNHIDKIIKQLSTRYAKLKNQ